MEVEASGVDDDDEATFATMLSLVVRMGFSVTELENAVIVSPVYKEDIGLCYLKPLPP